MKPRRSDVETCRLNGWGVGTVLRGHETWSDGGTGIWTTIRITALGEQKILARCLRHEETHGDAITDTRECGHYEHTWTLGHRDWHVTNDETAPQPEAVAALNALTWNDQKAAHEEAGGILESFAPPEVAEAYRNACERVGFWYS